MKRISLLLFSFLFFSCGTHNLNYNRDKIIKKYTAEFDILIDSKKMDLQNVYLDKKNIKDIKIDRKNKTIEINQLESVKFFRLKELNLDSLNSGRGGWEKNKIGLIIIDGIPLTEEIQSKTLIDLNAIKDFRILKGKDLEKKGTTIFRTDRDYLIITTE